MENEGKVQSKSPRKGRRIARGILIGLLSLWALVVIVLQAVLTPAVLTRVVNHFADEYVDGAVSFSGIKASMFKSFPNLNVTVDGLSLTYPHDRFAAFDSFYRDVVEPLRDAGRNPAADTLASLSRLSVSVNYVDLLFGKIHIRHAILERPRVFAHRFGQEAASWNMFRTGEDPSDTARSSIPPIKIGKVSLAGRPHAVFTDPADTVFAQLDFKELNLKGGLDLDKVSFSDVSIGVDSLLVFGRLPADTLSFALDRFSLKNHKDRYDISLASRASLALKSAGRMDVPFDLDCRLVPDFAAKVFEVDRLKASVATIGITGSGKAALAGDSTYLKADLAIGDEPVSKVTEYFGTAFPVLRKVRTDARISLDAHCDGWLVPARKSLPPMEAHLTVPRSSLGWEGFKEDGTFDLEAKVVSDVGKLALEVPDLCLAIDGASVQLKGNTLDLLEDDPLFSVDSRIHTNLDSLMRFLPEDSGISASGKLDGTLKGRFRTSQLDLYNFGETSLEGKLVSDGITLSALSDTLVAYLGHTSIGLGPYSHKEASQSDHKEASHDHIGVTASIDSLYASYGESTFFRGSGINLAAHNTDEKIPGAPGRHPLHGHLDIASFGMMDTDSCFVGLRNSSNVFKLTQTPKGKQMVPYMSLSSSNKSIAVREGVNRLSVGDASFSVSAHPVKAENESRRRHLLDSLQKVYPGTPRDSLLRKAFAERNRSRADYLSDKDFAARDIHITLAGSLAEYVRDWDISGSLKFKEGTVITPYYPLENRFSDIRGKFTNNMVNLSSLRVDSGVSDISASGTLTGIRRMLTSGRGRLDLEMDITSERIDLDQILSAIDAGSRFVAPGSNIALSGVDDRTYLSAVQGSAQEDSTAGSRLLVLPSNLNAKVNIQAGTVKYSKLETSWVASRLEMKERCLQATNTLAMTNMGEAFLEGFYSTRTKKDLKAGFDLTLSNITAEKVIELFPAVDSILPMLKAFKGLLDCEIAATSLIDTEMKVVMPTLSGMIKIDGRDLSLADSEDLNKLRKTLFFKDRDSSYIDRLSLRGIIHDDLLEIFPFLLKVDRYTVAASGLQHFDQNFKYHVTAIKSPVPVRFGVNLKGVFDDWDWKLTKARYRKKLPSFEDEVDTVRFNLVNAIHNIFERGVDQAIRQNEQSQAVVESKKAAENYSADQPVEELTEEEKRQLETAGGEAEGEAGKAGGEEETGGEEEAGGEEA